ncbi:hypothetical protein FHS55_003776 [Angulomicrobium tetraedrale]|uniref:Uncharacterized protein n=1 Tax=Ancylobacter tetraedralis TaxID=217068 RepID=A0A839ZEU1_9HYPH|nr:hypothetical protein [Ancylobacter tetraedralis]MBB3773145.1 hypothetical protein [Ancylobacter tetraedralis]
MLPQGHRSTARRVRLPAGLIFATGIALLGGTHTSSAQFYPSPQPWPQAPQMVAPPSYGGPNAGYGAPRPPMMGSRCASQAGLCFITGAAPVGMPCYCQMSFGPVPGQIVP